MKSLSDQQHDFSKYLLDSDQSLMIDQVVDSSPFCASRRLQVYHDGYRLRLHETLQTDYPKVEELLGEEAFFALCIEYIAAYPSKHFSVRLFGEAFSHFLEKQGMGFLAEMANLEWSLMQSLDAPDAQSFTIDHLRATPAQDWGSLQLHFHPSVHQRTYIWDTPNIWKDMEHEREPRAPIRYDVARHWLFWRKGIESQFSSMSPVQVLLYKGFEDGLALEQITETMQSLCDPTKIPTLLVQNLQYWISEELFMHSQFI